MYACFGVSNAGLVLQDMLSSPSLENKKYKRKIGCIVSELNETLGFLYSSPNWRMYEYLWNIINKDFKS